MADALDQLHEAVARLTAEIGRAVDLLSCGDEGDAPVTARNEQGDGR